MPEFLAFELEVDLILPSSLSATSLFPRPGCVNTQLGTWLAAAVAFSAVTSLCQHHHRPSRELSSVCKLKFFELNTIFPSPSPCLAPGTHYSTFCNCLCYLVYESFTKIRFLKFSTLVEALTGQDRVRFGNSLEKKCMAVSFLGSRVHALEGVLYRAGSWHCICLI